MNFGTMVKPLHAGRAAESGIASAQMAALGYMAHPEAMEGPKGFFHRGEILEKNRIRYKKVVKVN